MQHSRACNKIYFIILLWPTADRCRAAKTHWHTNIHIHSKWSRFCAVYWRHGVHAIGICAVRANSITSEECCEQKPKFMKIEHKLLRQPQKNDVLVQSRMRSKFNGRNIASPCFRLFRSPCLFLALNSNNTQKLENICFKLYRTNKRQWNDLFAIRAKLNKDNGEILWRDWWLTCDRSHGLRENSMTNTQADTVTMVVTCGAWHPLTR